MNLISATDCQNCSLKTEYQDEWLDSKEAAGFLKVTLKTLYNLTSNGCLKYYKFGRRNRYRLNDLREFLSSQPRGGFHVN